MKFHVIKFFFSVSSARQFKKKLMGILNFEEQLVFYGQYHNNPWYFRYFDHYRINFLFLRNRAIHIIFVPVIFWTFFVWLSMIPIILLFDKYPFNVSFAITFLYIFYYILLEPVAGVNFNCNFLVYFFRPSMHLAY